MFESDQLNPFPSERVTDKSPGLFLIHENFLVVLENGMDIRRILPFHPVFDGFQSRPVNVLQIKSFGECRLQDAELGLIARADGKCSHRMIQRKGFCESPDDFGKTPADVDFVVAEFRPDLVLGEKASCFHPAAVFRNNVTEGAFSSFSNRDNVP